MMARVINGDLTGPESAYANLVTTPTQVPISGGAPPPYVPVLKSSLGGTAKMNTIVNADNALGTSNNNSAGGITPMVSPSPMPTPAPHVITDVINGQSMAVDTAKAEDMSNQISLNTNLLTQQTTPQNIASLGNSIPTYKYVIAGISIAIVLGTTIYLINR